MSFGPADLAASRRMKTTRVGGGHPGYRVIEDPDPDDPEAPRATAQQDPWHYSIARMVDACTSAGILPFYGPYGDIKDVEGCETQFRAAFLLGCVGAWSLHPVQIEIAKKVFSPDPDEVKFAKKVIEAIPDGRGVHMIDGKMQDDATWKQCKVMVELAEMLAKKDPELAEAYGSEMTAPAPPVGGSAARVFGLMVVRDAADLIRVNLLHHLGLGLERMLVVDNGSADGTLERLERLSRQLPIDLRVDPGPFRQEELTNLLVAEARRQGADWVVPIDVDEFFVARASLPQVLGASEAGALRIEVVNFVQRRGRRGPPSARC